jgi:competence protein ComEA
MRVTRQEFHVSLFISASLFVGGMVSLYVRYHPEALPDIVVGRAVADTLRSAPEDSLEHPDDGAASPEKRSGAQSSGKSGTKTPPAQPINVNQASVETLQKLPGIGPSLAGRIAAYRQTRGPFKSTADLLKVKGIGPAKLAKITPFIVLR